MSVKTLNLTPPVYEYLLNVSLREPDIMQKLRKQTATMPGANMQISPEQGQLMAMLVEMLGAKKTLDIGTFTGYSALAVARVLPDDGTVIACDICKETSDIAKDYWQQASVADKIELRLAPALETLQSLIDDNQAGTFDFAFIDADKQNYANYYEKTLKLLRPGGVAAIDNVLWNGRVADASDQEKNTCTIREFNDKLSKDDRITLSMIPIGDGLTLARKK